MSRVAKRPVDLPQGVTATVAANLVKVKGAKGELSLVVADGERRTKDRRWSVLSKDRANVGRPRAHIATW